MQIITPLPFKSAVAKLGERSPIARALTSSEWKDVPVALRERGFFSANVESARFLQNLQNATSSFLNNTRRDAKHGTMFDVGNRADFINQMQRLAIGYGLGDLVPENKRGGIQDITSESRLGLIFDTQTRQAQDYAFWRQGQDPDVLDEYPAQALIRVIDAKEPRHKHTEWEDKPRLKSDLGFWTTINQDFGVPWGPWGWGCGHDVEDIDRETAEKLGLIKPGQAAQPVVKDFNDRLQASTRNLSPDLVDFLKTKLGDTAEFTTDTVQWVNKPADPQKDLEKFDETAKKKTAVQNIEYSNPDTITWGTELATPQEKSNYLESVTTFWEAMEKRFQNMPKNILKTLLVTSHPTGMSNTGGSIGFNNRMVIKNKEWSDSIWKEVMAWEKRHNLTHSSERKGTQLNDNFRHELAHVLTTSQVKSEWGTIHNRYGTLWFRDNVTHYATKNELEALAECFGIATRLDYKNGTLPNDIESFIFQKMLGKQPTK